jgi:phage gpG-like protein
MPLDGVDNLLKSFRDMAVRADTAGQKVVIRSQVVFEAAVKAAFVQAHKRGAGTPSKPGRPPAVVTGTLRRSIVNDGVHREGLGSWSGRVFPTTVYARILELGGQTGRGGATHIAARPYMHPTLERVKPVLASIHVEEFNRVLGR